MARKRLSGPKAEYLEPSTSGAAPETKSMFDAGGKPPPPIAQVAAQSAAEGALQAVVDDMNRARAEGRMVLDLPVDTIATDHLTRDRMMAFDEDMQALIDSIRNHGQRTPIEVTELPDGHDSGKGYGLISGWRRLAALEHLHKETGDPSYLTVKALMRQPGDAGEAYVAMVEENEIRVGLSYYERARIAVEATRRGVFETKKQALLTLFATASRAKRSRIRSFIAIHYALRDHLRFPSAIPERLGLALVDVLRAGEEEQAAVIQALQAADPQTPEEELAALGKVVAQLKQPGDKNVPRAEHLPEPRRETLPGGLKLTLDKGKIGLSGKGITPELFEKLRDFLSKEA